MYAPILDFVYVLIYDNDAGEGEDTELETKYELMHAHTEVKLTNQPTSRCTT